MSRTSQEIGLDTGLFRERDALRVRHVELHRSDDLQQQREKLARIVLDEMHELVALLDAEGTVLEVNRASLEEVGTGSGDIQGRPLWDAPWWVAHDAGERLKRAIERASGGELVRYDVEILGATGGAETVAIDLSLTPVRDHNGRVVFLLAEGRNVTDQRRAEAHIADQDQEIERLLRQVKETDEHGGQFLTNVGHELRTPLSLLIGPLERCLVECANLTGVQRRDLEVVWRNAVMLLRHVNDLFDAEKLHNGAMHAGAETGTAVPEGSSSPSPPELPGASKPRVLVVEDNPEVNRFVSKCLAYDFSVDVAFNGKEGLAKVSANAPDLVVTDIMMPQMSGEEMTFELRKNRELDNLPILVLSAKADDALRIQLLRNGAQDYVVKPFSMDELRARAINMVKIKRARERLQSELMTTQHDLELLVEEVSTRKRELQVALDAMRSARELAERASEAKSTFLSLVSHEFRTPLTTMQLQLERLERDKVPLTSKQQQMLRKVGLSAERLMEIVESLLEYTRIDAGRITVAPEAFDAAALAADAVREFRPRAEQKGLDLTLSTDETLPFVSDARLLRIVVRKLVDNAIKFTEQGRVDLEVRKQDGVLRLCVRDTGDGIPEELRERILNPFEQREPASRKHLPGLGLGLAIAKRIVAALGGRIELVSEVGKGSEFVVDVPERTEPSRGLLH